MQLQLMVPAVEQCPAVSMDPQKIEAFLQSLQVKGRRNVTVDGYRRSLICLYRELPEDKRLDRRLLSLWRQRLLEQQTPIRTANAKISAVNGFLDYCGRRDLQVAPLSLPPDDIQPELTRLEYQRLLQTAKLMGKECTYLLVKVLCCAGVPLQDIPNITLQAVESGEMVSFSGGSVRFPPLLQNELLSYAQKHHVHTGPLFLTRRGKPLDRTSINKSIKSLCRDARVPEEKATPLCLRKLYQSTYADIRGNLDVLAEQAYIRLLEKEEQSIGWNV